MATGSASSAASTTTLASTPMPELGPGPCCESAQLTLLPLRPPNGRRRVSMRGGYDNHSSGGAGNCPADTATLLALYPGLRETGWAVLRSGSPGKLAAPAVVDAGLAGLKTRATVEPAERIAHQLTALSAVAGRWRPACIVRSSPRGMRWGAPGRDLLDAALRGWVSSLGLPLHEYAAPDVRAAVAGRPNASKDALGHAVMLRLGLIGQSRSNAEWEALAAGWHHLRAQSPAGGPVVDGSDNKPDG